MPFDVRRSRSHSSAGRESLLRQSLSKDCLSNLLDGTHTEELEDHQPEALKSQSYLQGVGNDHAREFRHDRFYHHPDKKFIGEDYDWSGVGSGGDGTGPWLTMVTPRYFLSSAHYHPEPRSSVMFYPGNDNTSRPPFRYTIDDWGCRAEHHEGLTDLWLGRLTEPLNPDHGIAIYPVFDLPETEDYVGVEILTYGIPNRVGRNTIDAVTYDWVYSSHTPVMSFVYQPHGALGEDTVYQEGGDSGGPSFVAVGDQLAVVGTHYINEHDKTEVPQPGWRSGDAFVPYFVQQFNDAIEHEEAIETITVMNLDHLKGKAKAESPKGRVESPPKRR
eukprot:TRINITY_DN10144_c0_g1_i1.p1 TRINITY_DN10144_c0_g1~~TRINITY_DN10144_c0_g1_i1.p1  ORF type:complete len:331 (-),score=82.19 TRINITY_DN10144_c0_g1_i1:208-1200(-)